MKYGFIFPGGEARIAAEMGRAAERAGWDGFFVPDAVWYHDPWVTLAAVAMVTKRIRLGTMLTPISRQRPWKLAAETSTLDRLSNGRVILSVGLGALDTGFAEFGETTDRTIRAELLDEGLEILTGLWRGQPFEFSGKHYHIKPYTTLVPKPPIQKPRIPIWVVGVLGRNKSMERVARWDGWLPNKLGADGKQAHLTPEDIRSGAAYLAAKRTRKTDRSFEIIVEGRTRGTDRAKARAQVKACADAGATWWLEAMWSTRTPSHEKIRARIVQGPPK